MFIYWGIFLILAAGALLNHEEAAQRTKLMFLVLASVPTALMIGLRWQIGPDWPGYLDIFAYTKLFSFDQAITHQDPGFILLIWVLHRFDAPFWLLNFICGIIFVAGLTAFSRRQPNPWLAYLVAFPYLVVVVGMSGDRQSAAIGLLFFALNAFEDRRLYRFVALVLAAAMFHGSILLILPICLLSYTRSGFQKALLLAAAAFIAYYYFRDVFSIYARRYSSEKIQSTGVVYRLAMNGLSALLFLLFQRRLSLSDHQIRLWRNVSLVTLALVLVVAVIPSSTAVDRFLLYLFPLQFLVLSRVPRLLSPTLHAEGQATLLVIGYAALVQVIFLVFGTFARFYIPYHSILTR